LAFSQHGAFVFVVFSGIWVGLIMEHFGLSGHGVSAIVLLWSPESGAFSHASAGNACLCLIVECFPGLRVDYLGASHHGAFRALWVWSICGFVSLDSRIWCIFVCLSGECLPLSYYEVSSWSEGGLFRRVSSRRISRSLGVEYLRFCYSGLQNLVYFRLSQRRMFAFALL
jgi:hypothetical protein